MPYDEYELMEDMEFEDEEWEITDRPTNTAFIATVLRQGESIEAVNDTLDELERLADTAGIDVLGRQYQRRNKPERSTYFGKGFLEDLQQKMLQAQAELLIINEELSPMQARNIEKTFNIHVIDRTEVILSIFHDHAKTKEARLQISLAELQYQLPRLKRLWGHFDKERGSARSAGGSASRGMGEKQIEIDKRLIREKISKIGRIISQIMHQKVTQRKQRSSTKKVCLVGYTNAGKSTLFNVLTDANVLVEDKLFATLDSTSRQLKLSTGYPIVLSDTVGFISNLPHHLVASFRATLMEVQDADLLLHLVDVSDERYEYYINQVNSVLAQIKADGIKQILVLNKADRLDNTLTSLISKAYPDAVLISALEGTNLEQLTETVVNRIFKQILLRLCLPYTKTSLLSKMHDIATVYSEEYKEDGIHLNVTIDEDLLYLVEEYISVL
ncbi:MAG: GTPase HflX [Candidatus Cloacimonetes bacterium HGW-Cloacimonetes-1]|jgi:GTP-binding protein HflX|nr:MAG: GTPase HflX [Candidatus Cloacimonetes bacterium HGW-Cloacimonetes-1]